MPDAVREILGELRFAVILGFGWGLGHQLFWLVYNAVTACGRRCRRKRTQ